MTLRCPKLWMSISKSDSVSKLRISRSEGESTRFTNISGWCEFATAPMMPLTGHGLSEELSE